MRMRGPAGKGNKMASNMSQDRRDAMHWAEEWRIRQRNKRILVVVCVIVALALLGFILSYVSVMVSRSTFESEEAMKEALQGRYTTEYEDTDIVIDGDTVTLSYYNRSHYDLEYAQKYGYSEYEDSAYEDKVVKWDYNRGVIVLDWMEEIKVDKEGNLVYYDQPYKKTDAPKPTPFDPSLLNHEKEDGEEAADAAGGSGTEDAGAADDAASGADMPEEEQAAQEESEESLEKTEEKAEDAGVEPLPETGNDV